MEAAGATRAAAGTGAAMHARPPAGAARTAMHARPRAASARPARSAGTATGPARMRKHHARAACDKRENQFLVIHVMPLLVALFFTFRIAGKARRPPPSDTRRAENHAG